MSFRLVLASRRMASTACIGAGVLLGLPAAQAGEVYGQLGLPGFGVGFAQPINSMCGVRADWVSLGNRSTTQSEEGVDYAAKLNSSRLALLADVFPFQGSFRVTAGMTSNHYKLELDASGAGKQIFVGNNPVPYTLTAADGYNVQIKFPRSTPYLGIGWGHQQQTGLRFAADLGAMIGKATLTATGRGQFATIQGQTDVDAELAELRDGVGKIRFVPQISFAIGYAF
ncbi:MAG: hypothetical protein RL375_4246 [Pseudomonadota bacterium]